MGEQLRHEEGVPAARPVQLHRIPAAAFGKRGHTGHRERLELDPRDVPAQLSEDAAEGVGAPDLSRSVRGDQHARGVLDAATEVADEVDRGLVREVHVVEDQHRANRGELLEHGGEELRSLPATHQELGHVIGEAGKHLEQRAERCRGGERLTPTHHRPAPVAEPFAPRAEQRRLAGSGFSRQQDESPLAGVAKGEQQGQLIVPLDERRHRPPPLPPMHPYVLWRTYPGVGVGRWPGDGRFPRCP